MKSLHQRRVEEFMRLAGQEVPGHPVEPSRITRELRAVLLMEEVLETIIDGLGCKIIFSPDNQFTFQATEKFDIVKLADGCADVSVVNIGTLSACGISDERLLDIVDKNNLEKFGPGHSIREDGKLVKPPGHKPPDIASLLLEQGFKI